MLIGVGVLVAALMFVTGAFRKQEPVFAGKALSYWVLRYATDRPPYHGSGRNGAVREIGTNTIPYLLSWIKYDAGLGWAWWFEFSACDPWLQPLLDCRALSPPPAP